MTTIWFKNQEDAQDVSKLRMMAVANNLPAEDYAAIMEQRFEVVPNTGDDRGGYLVIIQNPPGKTRGNSENEHMSIWKRMFGSGKQTQVNDGELFTTRFSDQLQRISALGVAYSMFVRQYFSSEVVSLLAKAAAEKMALTRSDSKEHSFCFSKAPISYWICTLPCSIPEAKQWFGKAYGGYTKLLERSWSSPEFLGPHCEVLVHIVFGITKRGSWVNLTIFPLGVQRFLIKPILPIDLLTDEEKNM